MIAPAAPPPATDAIDWRARFLRRYEPAVRAAHPDADDAEIAWRVELAARADMQARARRPRRIRRQFDYNARQGGD